MVRLIEYKWDSTAGSFILSATLDLIPKPRRIRKEVKREWRIRHIGRRILRKKKFRRREHIDFTFDGSCRDALRSQLEYYAKQHAVFELTNIDLDTPDYTSSTWNPNSLETVFVVIEKLTLEQIEARPDWFNYSMTLKRVNTEDIAL